MTDELTDTELDALEALALAAIPGYPMDADDCTGRWKPWFNFHGDPYVAEDDESAAIVATVSTAPLDYGKARAEFMGAADPATVLRLVAALRSERTQQQIERDMLGPALMHARLALVSMALIEDGFSDDIEEPPRILGALVERLIAAGAVDPMEAD